MFLVWVPFYKYLTIASFSLSCYSFYLSGAFLHHCPSHKNEFAIALE